MKKNNEVTEKEYKVGGGFSNPKLLPQEEEVIVYPTAEAAEFYLARANYFDFYSDNQDFNKRYNYKSLKSIEIEEEHFSFGITRAVFKEIVELLDETGIIDVEDNSIFKVTDLRTELEKENIDYNAFCEISNYAYCLHLFNWDAYFTVTKEKFKDKLNEILSLKSEKSDYNKLDSALIKLFDESEMNEEKQIVKFYLSANKNPKERKLIPINYEDLNIELLDVVNSYFLEKKGQLEKFKNMATVDFDKSNWRFMNAVYTFGASTFMDFENNRDSPKSRNRDYSLEFVDFMIKFFILGKMISPERMVYKSLDEYKKTHKVDYIENIDDTNYLNHLRELIDQMYNYNWDKVMKEK